MARRRKHKAPFGAYAALLFNSALCLAPFIATRAMSTAFGEHKPLYEASSEALTATRQAVDARFAQLATSGQGDPKQVWINHIREEMDKGDMTQVQGLILAARSMLKGPDGEALRARAAVADSQGEQALVDAAVVYLPEDLQVAYEQHNASFVSRYVRGEAETAGSAASVQTATLTPSVPSGTFVNQGGVNQGATAIPVAEDDTAAEFNVLGTMRDLSVQAQRWIRDDKVNEVAFILQGVGLILADRDAREGASVLLAAGPGRGDRLDKKFNDYLSHKLFAAVDPVKVRAQIKAGIGGQFGYGDTEAIVEKAFKSNVDANALASLQDDLRVVRDIAHDTSLQQGVTSAASAVDILSVVKDGADLRKARLITQAVGNAAPALVKLEPAGFLDTAKTVITWNNALRLQLAGLGACFALLVLISLNVMWRSLTRNKPKRRSAVYGLDEVMLES
jgi:hypothetical protein